MNETKKYSMKITDVVTGESEETVVDLTDEQVAAMEALGAALGKGAVSVVEEHRKWN